jgi:hypothetical protein
MIDDPRIVSPSADTGSEPVERDILDRLAAITQRSRTTQRTAEEQHSDREHQVALLKQLGSFRRGVLAGDHRTAGNPHVQSPVPAANQPSQDHHRPDDIDDDPASSDVPQESSEDIPATNALAWFASSTPFQERKRPARQPGHLAVARKSAPQPRRPHEERQILTVGFPMPPSSDDDELFASGDEWEAEQPRQQPAAAPRPAPSELQGRPQPRQAALTERQRPVLHTDVPTRGNVEPGNFGPPGPPPTVQRTQVPEPSNAIAPSLL